VVLGRGRHASESTQIGVGLAPVARRGAEEVVR